MTKKQAVLIKKKLSELARGTGEDLNELIARYTKESFLFRLSKSEYKIEIPVGLTEEYLKYKPQRSKLWKKLYSEGIMDARPQFSQAIAEIREFLVPPLQAAAKNAQFDRCWSASEKWQPKSLYEDTVGPSNYQEFQAQYKAD